jgi:hypothetical protein
VTLPAWARALESVDRGAYYLYRLHEIVRDELFFGFLDPSAWPEVTDRAYADLATYLPGGSRFEAGLFEWEDRALSAPPFPRSGRVLLGAAGGGREMRALLERGYEVVAFEPNERLFAGASEVARDHRGGEIHRATYADLVRAVEQGDGPLASVVAGPPFDAVLLGWGSITHLCDPREQVRLFAALARLCPKAPVLTSFYTRPDSRPPGRADRARAVVRGALRLAGSRARHGDELTYATAGGFAYCFSAAEINALAATTGYEVTSFAAEPFGHAVLVPVTSRS